ncbi:MAG TPA: hypothetical protein PLV67_05755 [Methanofastidiosum sp.]|nr:hypothetical protein [Methanofastidiosum sp.]
MTECPSCKMNSMRYTTKIACDKDSFVNVFVCQKCGFIVKQNEIVNKGRW